MKLQNVGHGLVWILIIAGCLWVLAVVGLFDLIWRFFKWLTRV